ncbi:mechanosensitive ion channel family protein [Natrarchaeobius chitinivorans]|nr:mechanosensitive ion channel domain-containing protein [Natrarchaeobius chitinivorans]
MWSAVALQSRLRPRPIPQIQETYLATLETQLLATLSLGVLVALGIGGISRVQPALARRYGLQLSESAVLLALGSLVVVAVYALSVIWHVTFVLEYTLQAVMIDRWLAAQQLITAAIVLTAYMAIRFVNRSIDALAKTDAITKHQSEVAYHVADIAIVAFAGTVLLTLWGIDLTNVFIGAGAITAIVALTARETLTAMLAGFILLFSRPFRVGDWIAVNETTGIVTDVTIFTTEIQTFDDRSVLVPNDEITDSQLTNFSQNDQLRVDIDVGIDYEDDPERARSIIVDAVSDLELVKDAPDPQVVAKRFDDSAIVLECRIWIADPTMRRKLDARTAAIEAIVRSFDREGISIPFPQRTHAVRNDTFPVDTIGHEDVEPVPAEEYSSH